MEETMRSRIILRACAAMIFGLSMAAGTAVAQTADTQRPPDGVQTSAELKLGERQVSKIRQYFSGASTDRPAEAKSDSISVGAKVPAKIVTEPLPGAILVELPAGVDYHYFLRGEDLVILNAESRVVVAIVPKAS